jgi:hypothetical protein
LCEAALFTLPMLKGFATLRRACWRSSMIYSGSFRIVAFSFESRSSRRRAMMIEKTNERDVMRLYFDMFSPPVSLEKHE